MNSPSFAVVGRPSKGKSSIISTLFRDDSVVVGNQFGTTKVRQEFSHKINGLDFFRLFDTPGFTNHRPVREWLELNQSNYPDKPSTVRGFYDSHLSNPQFKYVCEILKAIFDATGILYVVNGKHPWGDDYCDELTILRWIEKEPFLALINNAEADVRSTANWKNRLTWDYSFKEVFEFDAQKASFYEQIDLIEELGRILTKDSQNKIKEKEQLKQAIAEAKEERKNCHDEAAGAIAKMLKKAISYSVSRKISVKIDNTQVLDDLEEEYREGIEKIEEKCREEIKSIYKHTNSKSSVESAKLNREDLSKEKTSYFFGLGKTSLIVAGGLSGGASGAGAGAAVDAVTAGFSFGVGTVVCSGVGFVTGSVSAWKYRHRIARINIKKRDAGKKQIIFGPPKDVNIPLRLFMRALDFATVVADRNHSIRSQIEIKNTDRLCNLSEENRKKSQKLLTNRLRGKIKDKEQDELREIIVNVLSKNDS